MNHRELHVMTPSVPTRRACDLEKNETVSRLLREFEETSADWLWQTYKAGRLIHVSPRLAYALGASADALEGIALLQALSGDAWETGQFPKVLHDKIGRAHV